MEKETSMRACLIQDMVCLSPDSMLVTSTETSSWTPTTAGAPTPLFTSSLSPMRFLKLQNVKTFPVIVVLLIFCAGTRTAASVQQDFSEALQDCNPDRRLDRPHLHNDHCQLLQTVQLLKVLSVMIVKLSRYSLQRSFPWVSLVNADINHFVLTKPLQYRANAHAFYNNIDCNRLKIICSQ